ncbi:MAG: hypothetical protein V2A67_07685 [Bacteroidota bacterium]
MEQEHFDPEFQRIYDQYIRKEKEEAANVYSEMLPELKLPARRIRWWYPVAAAVLILATGTVLITSDQNPFRTKSKYTDVEVRESLEKTIHALSTCSKTVREEFKRIEDLTAMTEAIKPGRKPNPPVDQKHNTQTSNN